MDNLLTVAMEAHSAERNHHRRYEITVGRDLFDAWTVAICYGRHGRAGREDQLAGVDVEELKAVIRERLRRRLSAQCRIGVPYRLTKFERGAGVRRGRLAAGGCHGQILPHALNCTGCKVTGKNECNLPGKMTRGLDVVVNGCSPAPSGLSAAVKSASMKQPRGSTIPCPD